MGKLSKTLRKMKKGGASPLTLAKAVMSSYTGGNVIDKFSANHDQNTATIKGKGVGAKSRKRVSTEQKINAQITKLSKSVEFSTEKELLKRIEAKNEAFKKECIEKRLKEKRLKNLEIIKNLENEISNK